MITFYYHMSSIISYHITGISYHRYITSCWYSHALGCFLDSKAFIHLQPLQISHPSCIWHQGPAFSRPATQQSGFRRITVLEEQSFFTYYSFYLPEMSCGLPRLLLRVQSYRALNQVILWHEPINTWMMSLLHEAGLWWFMINEARFIHQTKIRSSRWKWLQRTI